jgi:hypothetical protein
LPKYRTYNTAITIEATDWLSLHPAAGTYPLGSAGKLAVALKNRSAMPGNFPMRKPKDSYLDAVEDHLDTLAGSGAGHNLMNALMATGHVATIRPPSQGNMTVSRTVGASISQTVAGFDDAYVRVVRHLRQANPAAARAELLASMNAAAMIGLNAAALAAIVQGHVLSYNAQQCLNGVAGPAVGIAPRLINVTAADIMTMRNGPAPLVDSRELRYVALALERFLAPGPGTNVTVVFDPWAWGIGMLARPPYISVGHELLHALDAMSGTRIFDNEPEEECIYIPCGAFGQIAGGGGNRPLTENVLRAALAQPNRALI